MKKQQLAWTLSHRKNDNEEPKDTIPASVPGAVQLDYAKAFNYKILPKSTYILKLVAIDKR